VGELYAKLKLTGFKLSCYFYFAGHCESFDQLALPNKHLLQQASGMLLRDYLFLLHLQ
jgi:hypothetical protein